MTHPDPVIRQVVYDTFIYALRYLYVPEVYVIRCENLKIPIAVINTEVVRQLNEMPSKEYH